MLLEDREEQEERENQEDRNDPQLHAKIENSPTSAAILF